MDGVCWMTGSVRKTVYWIAAVLLIGIGSYLGINGISGSKRAFATEVIVRTVENFNRHDDVVKFMDAAKKHHVRIVNVGVKQDEDKIVPSGYVFYKSSIAPIAPGYEEYDVLDDVIREAHERDIQIRAWIPQFHDQAATEKNGDWQMKALIDGEIVPYTGSAGMEYFANPIHPDVQAYERSIIREIVSRYDVDGVVLDWLRFDDFHMDMGSYTRETYKASFGYDPITIDFTTDNEHRRQWNDWRTTQLGSYVKDINRDVESLKPGLPIGVYILPPEFVECGQDASKWKSEVDFVSPMSYFADWGFASCWVYDQDGIIAQTKSKIGGKEIIPAFDVAWMDEQYREIYAALRKSYPRIRTLSYFFHGRWTEEHMQGIDARRKW